MKSTFFSILIATAFIACQKDPVSQQPTVLTGNFQWTKSKGGFSGGEIFPSEGEVITLHLLSGNRFEKRKNGKLTASGTYVQQKVISVFTNKSEDAIILSDNSSVAWLIRAVSITSGDPFISFQENCSDCYEHFYKVLN